MLHAPQIQQTAPASLGAGLSPNATKLLAWCRASVRHSPLIDLPVVPTDWHGMARALDLPDAGDRAYAETIGPALRELHEGGHLRHFDHGPETFGHTSLILAGADATTCAALNEHIARLRADIENEYFSNDGDPEIQNRKRRAQIERLEAERDALFATAEAA